MPVKQVADRLAEATQDASHDYWQDTISLLKPDLINWRHILGTRQVTDAYLLALAVEHKGQFITFDQGISVAAVNGAKSGHLMKLVA